jgi:hypothetical protein
VTCSWGIKTCVVYCPEKYDECLGDEPESSTDCFPRLCPVYEWVSSDFSECSVTCGGQVQTRTVHCEEDGVEVEDALCIEHIGESTISTSQECATEPPCEPDNWWCVGTWSSCDAACGTGTKTRTVECLSVSTGEVVDDSLCSNDDSFVPDNEACCFTRDCLAWEYGSWSSCYGGMRSRTVQCMGTEDGTAYCDDDCVSSGAGSAPSSTETCDE